MKVFSSHFIKALIIFRCIYYYYAKPKVGNVFAIYFETNIRLFLFLYILFAIHHSLRCWCLLFKAKSGSRKNINFSVFEVFCLSSSWKYRFSQNVNRAKVQSKTISIANFTLIRQDEDCLRADFKSEVWSQKSCIETP